MKRSYHFTTSVWRQAATPSCRTNWICLSFFNVSELQLKPVPVWWRLIKNIKSKCGSSGPWHTVTHSNRICYSELTQGSGDIHGRLRSCSIPDPSRDTLLPLPPGFNPTYEDEIRLLENLWGCVEWEASPSDCHLQQRIWRKHIRASVPVGQTTDVRCLWQPVLW